MTVLEALATLEAATLECKKRDINTPEVGEALDLLEPYIWPKWLVPQFRHEARDGYGKNDVDREGQQQVLRATFPGIRDGVRELLGVRTDAPPIWACRPAPRRARQRSDSIYSKRPEEPKPVANASRRTR